MALVEASTSALPADEVHVWVVDVSRAREGGSDPEATLDPEEHQRAARFRRSADREVFVAAHAGMRQILARYLCCELQEIVYEYSCRLCGRAHGKPSVLSLRNGGSVEFNMSRSGPLAVMALTASAPVGIDVERVDQGLDVGEIAGFFAPAERDELLGRGAGDRQRDCLVTWTRKEAYTKAVGAGLSRPLDDFVVTLPPDPPRLAQPPEDDTGPWLMVDVELPESHVGTVVARGDVESVRTFAWDPM